MMRALFAGVALSLLWCPSALGGDWQRERGANFTAWWHDTYEQPRALQELAALRATGATDIALVSTWYMDARDSSSIAPDPLRTPSDAGLLSVMESARTLGMRVTLKPHVDVRDGTFRALIAPQDVSQWFTSYRQMIEHYAELAQAGGARALVIGTELTSMSVYVAAWRQLIEEARAAFAGRLTFAANWIDGARQVNFWPQLDYIGVDAYMPLARSDPNPSTDALTAAWCSNSGRNYVRELGALHERYGKPVLFTEIGYERRLGTAASPWGGAAGLPSAEPQQRAYEAAYRAWSGVPWLAGIYWWDWRAGGDDAGADSYSPESGAAQSTMREWNTGAAHESVSPCARPAVTMKARVGRERGRHGLAHLAGFARRGDFACGARVRVRIERWSGRQKAWRTRTRIVVALRAGGRYRVARHFRHGRYRARTVAVDRACRHVRSPYKRFRIRRAR